MIRHFLHFMLDLALIMIVIGAMCLAFFPPYPHECTVEPDLEIPVTSEFLIIHHIVSQPDTLTSSR